jgi:hypothetical protein
LIPSDRKTESSGFRLKFVFDYSNSIAKLFLVRMLNFMKKKMKNISEPDFHPRPPTCSAIFFRGKEKFLV